MLSRGRAELRVCPTVGMPIRGQERRGERPREERKGRNKKEGKVKGRENKKEKEIPGPP